jgi:hypothetical protein
MAHSKSLGHGDESGFYFAQEMLAGDVTAGINFDRLQRHPKDGYIIFEYNIERLRHNDQQPARARQTKRSGRVKKNWSAPLRVDS